MTRRMEQNPTQTSAHDPLSALVARNPGGVWGWERKKGTRPSQAKEAAIRLRRNAIICAESVPHRDIRCRTIRVIDSLRIWPLAC
jgi:hypothetical protein